MGRRFKYPLRRALFVVQLEYDTTFNLDPNKHLIALSYHFDQHLNREAENCILKE